MAYNATGKVVPSFDKTAKAATLNTRIPGLKDSATLEMTLTGGATADVLSPYSDEEDLHVEGADKKSIAALTGKNLVLTGELKDTGDYTTRALVHASFGSTPPADGKYNFNVTAKLGSQILTGKVTITVESKKLREDSLTLKRTGTLDVYNRNGTALCITPVYTSLGNDWEVETVELEDPSLLATFDAPTLNPDNTIKLRLSNTATDIRTKKAYTPYLKVTLQNRENFERMTFVPNIKLSTGGQSAMKNVKVTQAARTVNLLNAERKAVTTSVINGTANNGTWATTLNVQVKQGSSVITDTTGKLSFKNDGTAPLNNRNSVAVYDDTQFTVNMTANNVTIAQKDILRKAGKYRVKLYLYPEGCANDTAAKVVTYVINVK